MNGTAAKPSSEIIDCLFFSYVSDNVRNGYRESDSEEMESPHGVDARTQLILSNSKGPVPKLTLIFSVFLESL